MPRDQASTDTVFRAVLVYEDGSATYYGPYTTIGAARSVRSSEFNWLMRRQEDADKAGRPVQRRLIAGTVEPAKITWDDSPTLAELGGIDQAAVDVHVQWKKRQGQK